MKRLVSAFIKRFVDTINVVKQFCQSVFKADFNGQEYDGNH
jgi:hypothetical protein